MIRKLPNRHTRWLQRSGRTGRRSVIRKFPNRQRVLLQVIVQEEFCSKTAMRTFSGYSFGGTDLALVELKQLGLVYQHFSDGIYCATERGKVALAILIGQEAKKRPELLEKLRRQKLKIREDSRFVAFRKEREARFESLREFGRRLKQELDAEFGCGPCASA